MGHEATLLLGIGNVLRGDDGVGAFLVEEWAREQGARGPQAPPLTGTEWKSVQQLTPELAPLVAMAGRVLMVDAWAGAGSAGPGIAILLPASQHRTGPRLLPTEAKTVPPGGLGGHGLDPLTLLWIARSLYGWRGEGALLRVPAHGFGHGSGFSAPLKRSLPRARQLLRHWLRARG